MTAALARLRAALAAPDLPRRLAALAAGAAASAPLTLEVELGGDDEDWLALLPAQGEFWYWAQPANADWCLALGSVLHYETVGSERFAALDNACSGLAGQGRREAPATAFFGFAFDEAQAPGEQPNTRLVLPALVLRRRGGRNTALLSCTAGNSGNAPAHWQALLAQPAPASNLSRLRRGPPELEEQAWLAGVQAALRAIADGQLDKVVLTRSIRLQADAPLAPRPALAALLRRHPGCTVYALGNGRQAFLGATPERLVRLRQGRAEADALAGTAWNGAPRLDSDKNCREQGFVAAAVAEALAGLCDDVATPPAPETLHFGDISHLRTRVQGSVRQGVSLFHLAAALHPTPAVGGSPRAAALDWLRRRREKRPGWYSGGFGWIDTAGDGEIAVALRCATLAGSDLVLCAGAGIVAGSDPREELAETEAKLRALRDVLDPVAEAAAPGRTGTA